MGVHENKKKQKIKIIAKSDYFQVPNKRAGGGGGGGRGGGGGKK